MVYLVAILNVQDFVGGNVQMSQHIWRYDNLADHTHTNIIVEL